jgi:cysteine desulfurase
VNVTKKPIYLDYNATTPIDPEVGEAMLPYLKEHFGNPSSSHWFGIQTKKAVQTARKQVAEFLDCLPDEVIFTSGGSESNNYAIKGFAFANRNKGNHIITSRIEHPAVIEVCRYLETAGFEVTYLPVDEFGSVDMALLEEAIRPQTILISIMHANNEVGTIQLVSEISELAHRRGIIMHTDAAQSCGKIPAQVSELGVDLLSLAGHKLYGPKGIGALYVRHGTQLEKLIHGADHEQDRRAGTENVLEIVGLGKACEMAGRDLEKNASHMRIMRDRLENGLKQKLDNLKLNGHPEKRLPNTLSFGFRGIEANTLLSEIEEVAASPGAACHTDKVDVSHVLEAMKIPLEYAMGTVRFSTGRKTTAEEIDKAIDIVAQAVLRLKPEGVVITETKEDLKEIKLTHFTHGLGCACKLRPQALEEILAKMPSSQDVNVLVGTNTADDACVYRLDENTAVVQTVDFFTPIVDDPYHFGAISAANSLSDIYAMGGKPLFALSIVGFPSARLPLEVLYRILSGAQDKANEAGISIIGGHTVDDTEPKYGLAVTGIIDPRRVFTNSNAQPGDAIVLTKPIGVGIISTAIKRGLADEETTRLAIQIMSQLNRKASEVMVRVGAHAATDVTGFGLLGHLKEMTKASRTDAVVYHDRVPVIAQAEEFAGDGVVPGGTLSNLDFVADSVEWDRRISRTTQLILADAQTSGGLLIALPSLKKDELLEALKEGGLADAAHIGDITKQGTGKITVR